MKNLIEKHLGKQGINNDLLFGEKTAMVLSYNEKLNCFVAQIVSQGENGVSELSKGKGNSMHVALNKANGNDIFENSIDFGSLETCVKALGGKLQIEAIDDGLGFSLDVPKLRKIKQTFSSEDIETCDILRTGLENLNETARKNIFHSFFNNKLTLKR